MSEKLPKGWKRVKLGEVADITKLAGFEYTKYIKYVDDGEIIALRALNVRNGNLDLTNVKKIYKHISDKLERSKLYKNDILFTYIGANIGQFALVPENDKFHLAPNICRIRCNDKCEAYFLYSYFRTNFFQENLENFIHGSSQPTIPMKTIRQIPIILPSLPEQKAIASVLSSLDDKIDLLHRQNQTLEQMAQTLFRKWFIEEAKEDWDIITFGDLVKPKKGKNLTKSKAIEGDFPVVAGGIEPSCYHNEANTKSPVITISASGANAGYTRLYHTPVWSSDSSYIDETVTPYIYFSYVFLKINQERLFDKQEGSAQPHIYPSHIMDLEMLNYPEELIKRYEEEVTPFFEKIKSNILQIRTLEKMRDSLLPKLMSGEVRVKYD